MIAMKGSRMSKKKLTGIVLALVLAAVHPARAQQDAQTVGVPVSYESPPTGRCPRPTG